MKYVVDFNPFKNDHVVMKEGKTPDGTMLYHKVKGGFKSKEDARKYADKLNK